MGQLSYRGSCHPGAVVPLGQLSPGQLSPGALVPGADVGPSGLELLELINWRANMNVKISLINNYMHLFS